MEEEIDPILAQLNSTTQQEPDPILDQLNGVKKKSAPEGVSPELGTSDFLQQQKQVGAQVAEHSEKSTPKPKSILDKVSDAWKEIKYLQSQPADPSDVVPSPFMNAVERGTNSAETANLVNPYKDVDKEDIPRIAELQRANRALPTSKEYQDFNTSKTAGEALTHLAKSPVKIISELTGESLSALAQYGASRIATGAAAGAVTGSVLPGVGTAAGAGSGVLVGMADSSLGLEYSAKFLESLHDSGVDVENAEDLKRAFEDDAVVSKARSSALKKGIPIAIFDLISGGIAGKLATKPAKSLLGKIALGAGEFGVQAAMGGAGEATGELISGEKLNPSAIISEMVGELGTTPIEVSNALLTFNKPNSKPVNQVAQEEANKVSADNPASADAAAAAIQQKVDQPEVKNMSVGALASGKYYVKDAEGNIIGGLHDTRQQAEAIAFGQPESQIDINSQNEKLQQQIDETEQKANPAAGESTGIQSTDSELGRQTENRQDEPRNNPQLGESADKGESVSGAGGVLANEKTSTTPSRSDGTIQSEGAENATTEDNVQGKEVQSEPTNSVALDQPDEEKVHGIKKALVSDEKIQGTAIERRSTEEMLNNAKADVDSGQINPKSIVDEITNGNARALQPHEVGALVYYKTQLDNKIDSVSSDLIKAINDKDVDTQANLRTQLQALNTEADNYHTMSLKTAYEQSLAFRLRQMLLNNEYNLTSQVNKYKAVNNGHISPEVESRFKELDTQLKAANAKISALETSRSTQKSDESLASIRRETENQKNRRLKTVSQKKESINAFFDSLKVKADPGKLNSITQVIGESVWNGSVEAVRAAVLTGVDISTAVKSGLDYVKEHYRGDDFNEDQYRAAFQPMDKIVPPAKTGKPQLKNGKLIIPSSIIRDQVESGVKDIDELTDRVHQMVVETVPDASTRDVRDAITKYGERKNLSKEEIDVKIREFKRVGRLVSALEDVQNKIRPLKSGLQRDKLTDQERRMQRELREAMKDLPIDQEQVDAEMRTALDAVKTRLKNQIADIQNQIETGERAAKKKGISYDDEAKSLQKQRDDLKAILKATDDPMSDEQKIRMAITSVERSIADYDRRIKEKDFTREKSTTPETLELKALREQRDALKSTYKDLEQELGVADKKRLETYNKTLKRSTEKLEQRIKDRDFAPAKKREQQLDDEAMALKIERDKVREQFDLEQEKARLENRSMSEKFKDNLIDAWNLPKSLDATLDMSAPFRQGALLSAAHPVLGAKAFGEMFHQAFSEKRASTWLTKLKQSPEYAVMKNAKLYLAEPNTKLTAKEEQFMSNLAGKIPVLGGMVKGSERAYTAFLNKLRVDVFLNGADQLADQGITPKSNPEAYASLANFINNASGRGNLGALENAAPVLNGLFFSPRYVASRINLINPLPIGKNNYWNMPAPVRKIALRAVISYVGFLAVFSMLMSSAFDDVEVEWDPRSSDFGKIKWGSIRYDLGAGFFQILRLISQVYKGQKKTAGGEIRELNGRGFNGQTEGDVITKFLRTKLAPIPGTMADIFTHKTLSGDEVTLTNEIIKNTVPLYLQDMGEVYKENSATGVIKTAIPAFFGVGVQDYTQKHALKNASMDVGDTIKNLNKKNEYGFSEPSKADLGDSFNHDVDDQTLDKFNSIRDKEIKRLFDRYKFRLEQVQDKDIYDRLMDNITKEAGREAKYQIAKANKWETKPFAEGNKFKLKRYKKNAAGKVEEK